MLHKDRGPRVIMLACLLAGGGPVAARAASAWDLPGADAGAETGVTLSVRPSLGVLEGEAREVVYAPGEQGSWKSSELTWDLAGVVIGGVTVSADIGPRLTLNAGAWTALNEGNGEMGDTDWRIEGQPWTDWSLSDAAVTEAILLDVNASWLLWRNDNDIKVRCLAGYRRDSWKWEDSLKRFVYSLNDFRDFAGNANGVTSIRYEQEFNIPYVGAGMELPLGKAQLGAYFRYSPWVSADDRDFHVLRELHFEESFSGGDYFGYGVAVTWPRSDRFFFSVALDGQQIPEMIGDMFIVEENLFIPDSAGIAHECLTVSAQAAWRF